MKRRHSQRDKRRTAGTGRRDGADGARVAGLPSAFVERVLADLGPSDGEALLASLQGPPRLGLRINSRMGGVLDVVQRRGWRALTLPWTAEGVVLEPAWEHLATSHPWHDAGAYYLQDPAAMGVVPILDPLPGERVLDLAAAPGGKSTYIADRLAGTGLLWSHDVDKARVGALVGNLERWGAANTVVSHGPVDRLAALHGTFDRVLLDAPCSGEGMFRKSRAAVDLWSPGRVAWFVATQARLLDAAVEFLRPGGVLVYSTCTFGADENEGAVAGLLARREDVAAEDFRVMGASGGLLGTEASAALDGAVARWWPHRQAGEGHFVARLRKADDSTGARVPRRQRPDPLPGAAPTAGELAVLTDFYSETLGAAPLPPGAVRRFGDWLHALPGVDLPEGVGVAGLQPRRIGTPLGRLTGTRFEPHHALSRRLEGHGDLGAHVDLDAADPRVAAYLRGETITAAAGDGWVVVRVAGLPLGWAKAKHGELNNHYPKGLRRG